MKALYRISLASVIFLFMTTVCVSASRIRINENISYDYKDNTFCITDSADVDGEELTVALIKGDYTNSDLTSVPGSEFYYIGQKSGSSYDDFGKVGVKYDDKTIEPGVYTLVTGGDGVELTKTKVVIGNVVNEDGSYSSHLHSGLKDVENIEFGTVDNTFRMYGESDYAYICVGSFNYTSVGKMGFVFQRTTPDGIVQKSYTELANLKTPLGNIASVSEGTQIQVGLQMNFVPLDVEFVAIPYVSAQ